MVAQLKGRASRFKKFEVLYIVACLSLQFITDVSTTDKFSKNVQSSVQLKDSSHSMPNGSTKQNNPESSDKKLERKSRATSELSSMFSEDDNESTEKETDRFMNAKKTDKEISLVSFPRIRRSKVDPNLLMPYPDSWLIPYISNTQNELNEINAPDFDVDDDLENAEYFSAERYNGDLITEEESILTDNEDFQLESITERQVDSNGTVIPYPRFGKRDISSLNRDVAPLNQDLIHRVKRSSDSITPQMRYGRSSKHVKSSKPVKQSLYVLPNYRPGRSENSLQKNLRYDKGTKQGILPYPRPGRSNDKTTYVLPQPRFGRSFVESKDMERMNMFMKMNPSKNPSDELLNSEEKLFLIPYPRPGKRFFGTKPLPPNVQMKDKEFASSDENGDKDQNMATFLVPYPRPGRSESAKHYIIPSARFGKYVPDTMLPLPRYGRSSKKNNIVPYPRPGRSENLLPQARFGRSLLPYPRPGRDFSSVLPYPRLGRDSIIPQMRVGKSGSLIPQMRVGKSDSLIPQMRVGKSDSLIPQMRVGKSDSLIPQMRVGKSNSLIPQMRVGKSNSLIPQMRVSKSASLIPQMRVGKSASLIPQMRVGKSSSSFWDVYVDDVADEQNVSEEEANKLIESNSNSEIDSNSNFLKSAVLIPAKKLQKHMLTSESQYMLPYPRPGRFI